jgi:hypothetical protein
LALAAVVDWVWAEEPLWLAWELAAEFLPCVLAVLEALLPDLPALAAFLAAARLALLAELLFAELRSAALLDPLCDPAEACDDEEPDELPVLDELDAGAGAAALGGGGATGVEITDSRPTRGHSLRPDAL